MRRSYVIPRFTSIEWPALFAFLSQLVFVTD
jgi:hypothetical protein